MYNDDRTAPIGLQPEQEQLLQPTRIGRSSPPIEQRILVVLLIIMLIPVATIEFVLLFSPLSALF